MDEEQTDMSPGPKPTNPNRDIGMGPPSSGGSGSAGGGKTINIGAPPTIPPTSNPDDATPPGNKDITIGAPAATPPAEPTGPTPEDKAAMDRADREARRPRGRAATILTDLADENALGVAQLARKTLMGRRRGDSAL